MSDEHYQKKLTAILYADIVEYSRRTFENERDTHATLMECRDIFSANITAYGGNIVNYAGDAVLADFPSVVDAITCALVSQRSFAERNENSTNGQQLVFRIGVNLGEVLIDGGQIYGHDVNMAERLQGLADPGGLVVSDAVKIAAERQLSLVFEPMGEQAVKNIPEPIYAFHVRCGREAKLPPPRRRIHLFGTKTTTITMSLLLVLFVVFFTLLWQWGNNNSLNNPASISKLKYQDPSIAVLPFDNITGNPDLEYISDGITEDIITSLAKFPRMIVIARHSVFAFKGLSADLKEVGDKLGVRYVLEGSVQRTNAETRITAQLIEAASGHHLWADRYDVSDTDIFAARDGVIKKIASTIMGSDAGRIVLSERGRAMTSSTDRATAYDYLMRGWEHFYRFTSEDNLKARRIFKEAVRQDPGYSRAYSAVAWTYAEAYDREWTDDYEGVVEQAFQFAKKGHELDSSDYKSHWALGWAYLYQWKHEQAETHYRRALELNPNDAELLAEMANFLINIGEPDQAIDQLRLAMDLNPLHEQWYTEYLGWAYEEANRPQDAIDVLVTVPNPEEWIHRTLAAAYAAVGNNEEALQHVEKILELNPDFRLSTHEEFVNENYPYKNAQLIDRWIEALRKAGVPE